MPGSAKNKPDRKKKPKVKMFDNGLAKAKKKQKAKKA